MLDEAPPVDQDTLGHEADKLLRTVSRAFLDDMCSIVLDLILRNHYQTCETELRSICKDIPPSQIRDALKKLKDSALITSEDRLHMSVVYPQVKEPVRQHAKNGGFVRFNYENQQKQRTEEQASEERKQHKQMPFYYVDYHRAVECIRYRLYKLLSDDTKPVFNVYRCDRCNKQYTEVEYMANCNSSYRSVCPEFGCGGTITDYSGNTARSKVTEENNRRRARFREALQPIIDLVNVVMKKSYVPFEQYSPEEEKIIQEHNREEEKKHANSGFADDVVNIEENLNPCPGALVKSERVRNRVIPWLAHHGFFSNPSSEGVDFIVEEDPDEYAPSAKRARVSEDADADEDETVIPLSQLTEEETAILRETQAFDRYLQQRIEAKDSPEDNEDVPDTVSIRSGSTFSADDQEVNSDVEMPPAVTDPLQEQQKLSHELTVKVCRDFDEDVLTSHVVYVRGEPVSLETVTLYDVKRMNDAEYDAFGHEVAIIAGIS